ncbi:MAG: aminopeptidase P family protein [Clostridiales bacterium]|nr:aminopeptidase P family protein [Clostridiales bacterium]
MINSRLQALREQLTKKNLQAILVTKKQDIFYLSSFSGDDTFLFITLHDAYLTTDFRYVEQAEREAPLYQLIRKENNLWDKLNDIIQKQKISRIGVQECDISFDDYKKYTSNLTNVTLLSADNILQLLRIKKTSQELDNIRVAVEIADNAFSHILNYIKVGMTEKEISLELEYFMRKHKASGVSFETIVASGVRSSMPHGVASDKIISYGDTITLDYGAIYNNYCSDMTRTIFIGDPNEEILKIYDIVKLAQTEAIKKAQPGTNICDIDKTARDVISNYGYGNYFGHALGHGVGLDVHELPSVSTKSTEVLEAGMVITIEPGIYLPNVGGVRIEDMLAITPHSNVILPTSSKDIIIL